MQDELVLDAAGGGHHGLRGDLPAEDALALGAGLDAAEQVDLELLEVEQCDELLGTAGHQRPSQPGSSPASLGSPWSSSPARNASKALPISSPVGSGSSPASSDVPAASASRKESYCCSRPRTTSPTSEFCER